ncbi:hypothetical protein [Mangrovimonas cancribranchiae]|uniref:Uncharacterized protein n=1 Tax=Mangrovimonas cancribranchiae TaxID=3080055 RepID=A0AAU6P5Q6_9FLAO
MSKTTYEVVTVTLDANAPTANEKINLPEGRCHRVGVAIIDGNVAEPINLAILDNSGNDVIKAHDHSFWLQRQGGDYLDSLKPVDFECNRTIKPTVLCPNTQAGSITFQFVFYISQSGTDY